MAKLCRECAHARPMGKLFVHEWRCVAPATDPVTGAEVDRPYGRDCYERRDFGGDCGPEGVLWERDDG